MRIKNILLDLDGPLLDGKQRHYQCYADILDAQGYSPIEMDVYWEMKRMRKSRLELLTMSHAESIYDLFLSEWMKRIEERKYLNYDFVQPDAINKLKEWSEAGISINLVTMRSNEANLFDQLNKLELDTYLSTVNVSEHVGEGRGKAETIRRNHPEISEISSLWVGDTEADYEGAKAFGCPVWLLSCGLRTNDFLQSLQPNFLSNSINDVMLAEI